jgi:hypothetical protein
MTTRKRIIYQSEAIFASNVTGATASGTLASSEVTHLKRVQSFSHSAEVTRTDVNTFGKLAAIDRPIIEEPTVSFDFNYLATNGYNESGLGLTTYGVVGQSVNCISGILSNEVSAEKNYYVLTVDEGLDADGVNPQGSANYGVVGIGNGFLTNYTFNAAVGEIPNVDASVEASNITFALSSTSGIQNPAIQTTGTLPIQYEGLVVLPSANETGLAMPMSLRPGDIVIDFGTSSLQMGGAVLPGMTSAGSKQSAHIQNVTLEVPLSRTPQQRLGNAFAFSRELDVPITVTMNVSANLADIDQGSLVDLICSDAEERTITVDLYDPCQGDLAMQFQLRGAVLDTQGFDGTIGDNKTVDLTFSAQIGGPNDQTKGLFISGRHTS